MMLAVPYIVYWLLVKDFLYNLDTCENNYNETGYCLYEQQCNGIVKGTKVGSCENKLSGSVCCKITLNYFNETYLLSPIFVRKTQTDTPIKTMLFSANTCSKFQIQYGNRSITSGSQKRLVFFNPKLHGTKSPDRIMWAIVASYSRESRDLEKQSSGQNYLYAVTLNKLVKDEFGNHKNQISECMSESDNDDNFYILVNPQETFPIRKFFTPEIQKLNNVNSTIVDVKNLYYEEFELEKQRRRSLHPDSHKQKDSTCDKQQWKDIFSFKYWKESDEMSASRLETNHIYQQAERLHNILKERDHYTNSMRKVDFEHNSNFKIPSVAEHEDKNKIFNKNEDKIFEKSLEGESSLHEKHFLATVPSTHVFKNKRTNDGNFRKPMQVKDTPYLTNTFEEFEKPVQREVTELKQNPTSTDVIPDFPEPIQIEATHDLRKPVQIDVAHDLRKPVQKISSHDMRKPVQIYSNHNMRQPANTVRESVKAETSHDMRKPITSDESHDLRWPVVEGETDLRTGDRESDIFGRILPESRISDLTNAREKLVITRHLDSHESNFNVTFNCKLDVSFNYKNESQQGKSGQKNTKKIVTDLWQEVSSVCGKCSGYKSETNSNELDDKWPWMVSLLENISGKYSHKCSASLLNSLWVITVAHCVDMKLKSDFVLILGKDLEIDKGNCIEMTIDEIIIHPKFNRGMFENDIALLRMKSRVTFQPGILPICLPWSVGEVKEGTPIFLGWGQEPERYSDDAQKLTVPIITNYECEILYSSGKNKEEIKDTFLCAGKNEANCDSESGSSLIALDSEGRWSLIGLVSWGSMCSNPEQPGVYTRISSYAQWIKKVIDCYESLL